MSEKSCEAAVGPVTATSAPASPPTVAGTTSERSVASERSDAASVPLPWTERPTTATVLSGLTSTVEGSERRPDASARSCSCLIAAWTGGAVTSLALITVMAGMAPPGKAAWSRS